MKHQVNVVTSGKEMLSRNCRLTVLIQIKVAKWLRVQKNMLQKRFHDKAINEFSCTHVSFAVFLKTITAEPRGLDPH